MKGWKLLGGGDWSVQNGVIRQSAEQRFVRVLVGDNTWTDYTITLKARELYGTEGFQILFRVDHDDLRGWWNLGGWNNTQHAIEVERAMDAKPGHIKTNCWYDIKMTVAGKHVKCWLNGQLIHDIDYVSSKGYHTPCATSARDNRTGDIIVKVVSTAAEPVDTELNLIQADLTGGGTATVLTSDNPEDENSMAKPTKVSPKSEAIHVAGNRFKRTFPGNSLTVLRLETKK